MQALRHLNEALFDRVARGGSLSPVPRAQQDVERPQQKLVTGRALVQHARICPEAKRGLLYSELGDIRNDLIIGRSLEKKPICFLLLIPIFLKGIAQLPLHLY